MAIFLSRRWLRKGAIGDNLPEQGAANGASGAGVLRVAAKDLEGGVMLPETGDFGNRRIARAEGIKGTAAVALGNGRHSRRGDGEGVTAEGGGWRGGG